MATAPADQALPLWPLVGRQSHVEAVLSLLRSKDITAVVLAGDAGVGKTRLANEVVERVRDLGFATERVIGSRTAQPIPFGALAPLLPPAQQTDSMSTLLKRFSTYLAARAADKQLLISVDDAHLLDHASLTLLQQVALQGIVSLLVTIRSGEAISDVLTSLWKEDVGRRVEIDVLTEEEVSELLSLALGARVDAAAVHRLFELSRGNPLFLRELVLGVLDQGTLRFASDVWRLDGSPAPTIRLQELIKRRLPQAETPERECLEIVALADIAPLQALRASVGPSVVSTVEKLGLVEIYRDARRGFVRSVHPLYAEVVLTSAPTERREEVAAFLSNHILTHGSRRKGDELSAATWMLRAHRNDDPTLLTRGARLALWSFDDNLAIELAQAARSGGARGDTGLTLVEASFRLGRLHELWDEFGHLIDQAENDEVRVLLTNHGYNWLLWSGRNLEANDLLRSMEPKVSDPYWKVHLSSIEANALTIQGYAEQAFDLMEPFLSSEDPRIRFLANVYIGFESAAIVGRFTANLTSARYVLENVDEFPALKSAIYPNRLGPVLTLSEMGDLEQARAIAASEYRRALEDPHVDIQSRFAYAQGRIALARGLTRQAIAFFRESLAVERSLGRIPGQRWQLGMLAQTFAQAGDSTAAAEAIYQIDELPIPPVQMLDADSIERGRAWAAAATGNLTAAIATLSDAADWAATRGQYTFEAALLHDSVRLGHAEDIPPRLELLGQRLEGELIQVRLDHARGTLAGDPVALIRCSIDFERMGYLVLAAEATALAAQLYRKRGHQREASSAGLRVKALLDRCEEVGTPLVLAIDEPVPLTRREREIAQLASQGLSSKEIAERLVVSVRTVNNLLQRAYDKLGVSTRRELSRHFGP